MALGMRLRRRLTLGVDLEDSGTGNGVLVVEHGVGFRKGDVDLANGAHRDGVDFEVFVAGCYADFDWELDDRVVSWWAHVSSLRKKGGRRKAEAYLHQARVENGVDGCVGGDAELGLGGGECAGEGYG